MLRWILLGQEDALYNRKCKLPISVF